MLSLIRWKVKSFCMLIYSKKETFSSTTRKQSNIQFISRSVDLEKKLLSSPKEFAEEVVTQVMGIERKLVKRLQQHFEEEVEECCKAVRLALPRTMSKIDWDINLNNVVAQLNHPIK